MVGVVGALNLKPYTTLYLYRVGVIGIGIILLNENWIVMCGQQKQPSLTSAADQPTIDPEQHIEQRAGFRVGKVRNCLVEGACGDPGFTDKLPPEVPKGIVGVPGIDPGGVTNWVGGLGRMAPVHTATHVICAGASRANATPFRPQNPSPKPLKPELSTQTP